MRKLLLEIAFLLLFISGSAQTVNDVLSNGIYVRKDEKIFLQKIGSDIQYNLANTRNFKPLPDSTIFLIPRSGINIHFQALNPLKYSYDTSTTIIADPISAAEDEAFKTIFSRLESIVPRPGGAPDSAGHGVDCPSLIAITKLITIVSTGLESDQKTGINATFLMLRDLSFNDKDKVQKDIEKIEKDSIKVYRNHFNAVKKELDKIGESLNKFTCNRNDSIIIRYVLTQIYKDLNTAYINKSNRLKNLEKAKKILTDFLDKGEAQPEYAPVWFNDPIFETAPEKKIVILNLTINQSGMEIKDDEIVSTEKKAIIKRVLKLRRFQRFIPEVSAGVAYLKLAFPKYGTTTNASGQQIVTAAGDDKFKKMNFTAMVNFIYYIEGWKFNPLIQVGVGENSDFPVLMIGGGFRLNTGARRISFTMGAASSWIKTLDKLKINDVVSGTSDIEKDLKYEFKTPKLYFGIQYNL